MPAPPDYDLLIIGGGMVGASLACALAGQALKIGVVEAAPWKTDEPPSYDDRGLALSPVSQRILAGIGIWPQIQAHATPIEHIHVSDQGHFGFTRLDARVLGYAAFGHVVAGRQLGQALLSKLAAQDNVDLISPGRIEALQSQPQHMLARVVAGGVERGLSARLLVAADGGDSNTRTLLGVRSREFDYRQTAVVANVSLAAPHHNTAYERFGPSGPVALLPLGGQRSVAVCVAGSEEASALLGMGDTGFLGRLSVRMGHRIGPFLKVGRRRAYPLKLVRALDQAGPRFAVIGNAAHAIHPNAAQGLNLGLRDAATLAECLVDTYCAGEDPGAYPLLRRYAEMRRADQRRVIALSHGLARLFGNDLCPLVIARDLAMCAIDMIPALKRALVRRAMGFGGPLPRLGRGIPL
ncbi:MAG: 2-octaprenyl-6-methoxyphenyl hydroxylase [Gammaproteobacteria bacterium]